jgi:hypothetical protein
MYTTSLKGGAKHRWHADKMHVIVAMHPQKSGFWSARATVRAENSGERARPRALKKKEHQGPVGPGIENRYQRL